MRYPYYRYQFGGAGSKESMGPEKGIESVTYKQVKEYEEKDWDKGWFIQSEKLPPPAGDKESFIKQRVLKIQKKLEEQQRERKESLTSISGAKTAKSKESQGLLSIGRKAMLEGRKTIDSTSRALSRLGFGNRGRRGSRSGFGSRRNRNRDRRISRTGKYKTEAEIAREARLTSIRTGTKTQKKRRTPIEGENKECDTDDSCGDKRLQCRFDPNSPKGVKSKTCKRRICNIYSPKNTCGEYYVCLPKDKTKDYYPLSQVEGLKGTVISKSTTSVKFNPLQEDYQEIANLQNKIFDYYRKLFGNLKFEAISKKINSIFVTPLENIESRLSKRRANLDKKISELNPDATKLNYKNNFEIFHNDFESVRQELDEKYFEEIKENKKNLKKKKKDQENEIINKYENTKEYINDIEYTLEKLARQKKNENNLASTYDLLQNVNSTNIGNILDLNGKDYNLFTNKNTHIVLKTIYKDIFEQKLFESMIKNIRNIISDVTNAEKYLTDKKIYFLQKELVNIEDAYNERKKARNKLVLMGLDLDTLRNNFTDLHDIYCKKELEIINPRYIALSYRLSIRKNYPNEVHYFKQLDIKQNSSNAKTKSQINEYQVVSRKNEELDVIPNTTKEKVKKFLLIGALMLTGSISLGLAVKVASTAAGKIALGAFAVISLFPIFAILIRDIYKYRMKSVTPRLIDRRCEKLYFLSYIKHCTDKERELLKQEMIKTNKYLDQVIKIRKEEKIVRLYTGPYQQIKIKKNRLTSILKKIGNHKNCFEKYIKKKN